jgi:hypothetical protein
VRWVDLCGPPGAGKSTIAYPLWGDKSVTWDGKLPPAYWKPFLDEITQLMRLVMDHPSLEAVIRMNDRSAKKMATVEWMNGRVAWDGMPYLNDAEGTFIQTGLVQRILGFGWRLHHLNRDVNLIRRALWLMPVSVGVVFLEADLETIKARNRARRLDPKTAHEDRSFQVPHMLPAIAIAKEVLNERGVPVLTLDVQHQSIDAARKQLLDFAHGPTCDAAALRSGCEGTILSPPPWWR